MHRAERILLLHPDPSDDRDAFRDVFAVVQATDAIAYTSRRAVEEADKAVAALTVLPDSVYRQALIDLARFSVERNF